MRAIIPLTMMVVPGAAYAQAADQVMPVAVAPQDGQITVAAATDLLFFAAPLALDAAEAPLAETAIPAIAFAVAPTAAEGTGAAQPQLELELQPQASADAADVANAGTIGSVEDEILVTATLADAADTEVASPPVSLADQADSLFATAPVSEDELAKTQGRAGVDTLAAIGQSNSNSSGNLIHNSPSGDVNVGNAAFNMTGIAMVNMNTGAGSSIAANMSVVVQINYVSSGQ